VSYHWYRADTLFDTIHQNVEVCPVDTTEYTLVTTTGDGCESSDTIVYNVIHMEFSIGSDTSICLNSEVTLYGPDEMEVYRWYEGDTSVLIDTVQNITVSPIDTTMYILYARDSIGAYNYDSLWVNILPLPDASITYSESVCDGDLSRVVVSPSTFYDQYIWHYNGLIDTSTIGVLVFIPIMSQSVSVEVVDNNLCSTEDDTFVELWPNPTLIVPDDAAACFNDTVTFTAEGDGTIWWEDVLENIISDNNTFSTVSITDTAFIVKDTSVYGCLLSDTVKLTTFSLPNVVIHYPDTSVCSYSNIELTGSGAETYTWFVEGVQHDGETLVHYLVDTTRFILEGESADEN